MKWGKLTHKNEIVTALAKIDPEINKTSIDFEHLQTGFSDNVFLVSYEVGPELKHVIAKEFLKEWHKKEAVFYNKLAPEYPSLHAAPTVSVQENFILLNYLNPESYRAIVISDLAILKQWISEKHQAFLSNPNIEQFCESYEIKQHYLIDKPIKIARNIIGHNIVKEVHPILENLVRQSGNLIRLLENQSQLPQTLEHGDLEPQNIFIDNQTREIVLIDWVNIKNGSGLLDINQYFETAKELDANFTPDDDLEYFARITQIPNFEQSLNEFRLLMLLNKFHFYAEKLLSGVKESPNRAVTNEDLVKNICAEISVLLSST